MSELLSQRHLGRILGTARVLRLVRAHWLEPAKRTPSLVLFRISDVRAVIRRLERGEAPPSDKVEVLRIRNSETRNGRGRIPKLKLPRPTVDDIVLDFSGVDLKQRYG